VNTSSNDDPPSRDQDRTGNHAITPLAGPPRQLDGTPADLLNPCDYPCEAICAECGQPVRCERWLRGDWHHIQRFSNS